MMRSVLRRLWTASGLVSNAVALEIKSGGARGVGQEALKFFHYVALSTEVGRDQEVAL